MADETDYSRLLDDLKAGIKPSNEILQSIRNQLLTCQFKDDLYTLIHILGKSHDIQSRKIIETYLFYYTHTCINDIAIDIDDGGMIRRIALQVLGRMWGIPEVFDIAADKAFHDPSLYVRMMAASVIGHLGSLHATLTPKAAHLLLQGMSRRDEEREVWESFYEGLLELLHIPIDEWPSAAKELTDEDIRWDVIARANQLASEAP